MHLAPTTSPALPRNSAVSQPKIPWETTAPFLALRVHVSIPQMFIERLLNTERPVSHSNLFVRAPWTQFSLLFYCILLFIYLSVYLFV